MQQNNEHINISQDKSALMAAERERQFIGDILADENSDYGNESPREEEKKPNDKKEMLPKDIDDREDIAMPALQPSKENVTRADGKE